MIPQTENVKNRPKNRSLFGTFCGIRLSTLFRKKRRKKIMSEWVTNDLNQRMADYRWRKRQIIVGDEVVSLLQCDGETQIENVGNRPKNRSLFGTFCGD